VSEVVPEKYVRNKEDGAYSPIDKNGTVIVGLAITTLPDNAVCVGEFTFHRGKVVLSLSTQEKKLEKFPNLEKIKNRASNDMGRSDYNRDHEARYVYTNRAEEWRVHTRELLKSKLEEVMNKTAPEMPYGTYQMGYLDGILFAVKTLEVKKFLEGLEQ